MVTAENVATTKIGGCWEKSSGQWGGAQDGVPTAILSVIELACKGIDMKRKIATISGLQTNLETQQVEKPAAGHTMRDQILVVESRFKTPQTKLVNAQFELEKQTNKSSRIEADH